MSDPIQWLNYHDGMFLELEEFQLEQDYHLFMRQRINFAIFNPGILYGLELEYTDPVLRVKAGMAIDETIDAVRGPLGREIILLQDSEPVDLSGFNPGESAWVTIGFGVKDGPPKPPTSPTPSRIILEVLIEAHKTDPGEGKAKIRLGMVVIGGSVITTGVQQKATLRLGGGAATLTAIVIEPLTLSITKGDSRQLIARGIFSDGNNRELGNADGLIWESNANTFVQVDSNGLIDAVDTGSATITASAMGKMGTCSVTVSAVPITLVSIVISPKPVPVLNTGENRTLIATGKFSDGISRPLVPGDGLTWGSDDNNIAQVSNLGIVTGVNAGTTHITASAQGISDMVNVTITVAVLPPLINAAAPFFPATGRALQAEKIRVFGSNFNAGNPGDVAVRLIARNGEVPDTPAINVATINDAEIQFTVPDISTPLTMIQMRIAVNTTGGEAISSAAGPFFRWRPSS